jgi:tetratricopeptide (TPR) repeat protein
MIHARSFLSLALLWVCACAAYDVAGDVQMGRSALMSGDSADALARFRSAAEKDPNYVANFTPLQEGVWTYVGRAYYEQGSLIEARAALERSLAANKKDFVARLYLGMTLIRLPQATKSTQGLSLDDVLFALREGVEPKRMAVLIAEKGIAFDLTTEAETNLRKAGADNQILQTIRTVRSESKVKAANPASRDQGVAEFETALKECLNWLETFTATSTEGGYWDPGRQIRSHISATLEQVSRKGTDPQILVTRGEWLGQELEEEVERARRQEQRDRKPSMSF